MSALKWWQQAVFYQIYPRSFADGNSDGIGDFPGMIAKLGYLRDLGVDAIWLSQTNRSPLTGSPWRHSRSSLPSWREALPSRR